MIFINLQSGACRGGRVCGPGEVLVFKIEERCDIFRNFVTGMGKDLIVRNVKEITSAKTLVYVEGTNMIRNHLLT